METKITPKSQWKVLDGNKSAAYGVWLCRPDVIAAYPITPQTPLLEQLYRFNADGLMDAEMVEVEGETSSMSVLIGASAAGARTFTSTSSNGLAFMFDAYFYAAGQRLPIVMVISTREMSTPTTVAGSQQDIITVKDAGWVQIHTENCQEILDSIIMAYRLAEDPDILLPVNVCYDGFYLSHLTEKIYLPTHEEVAAFLEPVTRVPRVKIDTEKPMGFAPYILGELFTEYRHKHSAAFQRTKAKLDQIDEEFYQHFGRRYGGQIEEYRTSDADIVLVAMGSYAGTAKAVVNRKRSEGLKVGLVKIRSFRPFPAERLEKVLKGKKAIGVIDRNVNIPWGCGNIFLELKVALSKLNPMPPMAGFIDGIAGIDITPEHIERALAITGQAAEGNPYQEVTWLPIE